MEKKKRILIYSAATGALIVTNVGSYYLGKHKTDSDQGSNISYTDSEQAKGDNKKKDGKTIDQINDEEGISAEQIVIKITDKGYVTSHGDHFHYYDGKVPFDALISEELVMTDSNYKLKDSDIVNEVKDGYIIKVDGKYYIYLKDAKKATNIRTTAEMEKQKEQTSISDSSAHASNKKEARQIYHTDDGYVFNPADVIQDLGDGFLVPHGDHTHYIPKSQLSSSELAAANIILSGRGRGTIESSEGSSYTSNKKTNVSTDHSNSKAGITYRTSDGFLFDGSGIQFHTETGIVVKHGNHNHFLSYNSLLGSKWAHLVPKGARSTQLASNQSKPSKTPQSKKQTASSYQTTKPIEPTKPTTPKVDKAIEEKLTYLANILGIKRSDLTLTKSDKGPLAIWKHGDHDHVYILNELAIGDKVDTGHDHESTEDIEAKRQYISDTYGVPLEAIKVKDNFFVFNEPTQDYDPTHIHPYLLRKDLVELPVVTGDPEIDFENELLAIAKHRNIKTSDIRIENGKFVIPYKGEGHGHTHYLNIKAKDGFKAYLKNKLPAIKGSYIAGDFDKSVVIDKVKAIDAEAETLFGTSSPRKYHRVIQALDDFKTNLDELVTNSTDGYLAMLEQFRQVNLLGQEDNSTTDAIDKLYNQLLDQVRASHIHIVDVDKSDLVKRINMAVKEKDSAKLNRIKHELDEVQRFDNTRVPTAIQYLDFFIKNINNPALSNELRENVAKSMGEIYRVLDRKTTESESYKTLVNNWVDTKIAVDIAKVKRETHKHTNGEQYLALVGDDHVIPTIKDLIKNFREDFKYIGSIKTPDAVVEPFGQPLTEEETTPALVTPEVSETPKHPEDNDQSSESTQPSVDDTAHNDKIHAEEGTPWTPEDQQALLKDVYAVQDKINEVYGGSPEGIDTQYIGQLWSYLAPIQANQGKDLFKEDFQAIQNQVAKFAQEILQDQSPLTVAVDLPDSTEPNKPADTEQEVPSESGTKWTEADKEDLLNTVAEIQAKISDKFHEKEPEKETEYIQVLWAHLQPIQESNGQNLTKEELLVIKDAVVTFGNQVLNQTTSQPSAPTTEVQPIAPETPSAPPAMDEQPDVIERPSEADIQHLLETVDNTKNKIFEIFSEDEQKQMEYIGILYGFLEPISTSDYGRNLTKVEFDQILSQVEAFSQALND